MIIATNAAETAVTFKDCWAVVDTCLVNQVVFDPQTRTTIQATVPCARSASIQRGGRAGRNVPGICVRLVTPEEWDMLPEKEPPQPLIEDCTQVCLRLLQHASPKVRIQILDELEIPDALRSQALEGLRMLGMAHVVGELTAMGKFAAELESSEVEHAAFLWHAHQQGVLPEAIIIFAVLSRGMGFVAPEIKEFFPHPDGDVHTVLNAWNLGLWLEQQTEGFPIDKMMAAWARFGLIKPQLTALKDYRNQVAEKRAILLRLEVRELVADLRTDRLAFSRLSLSRSV